MDALIPIRANAQRTEESNSMCPNDESEASQDESTWDLHDQAMLEMYSNPSSAVNVAHSFWLAVRDGDTELLQTLVTPESLDSWGDFSEAAVAMVVQIESMGLGTEARTEPDVTDVSYVAAYENIEGGRVIGTEPIAYITLVLRQDLGGWRVHAFGSPIPRHLVPTDSSRL